MADFATALRARLLVDPEVGPMVGPRIYWGVVPQGAALPYLRLTTISDPKPEHLKGYDAARSPRVQADCFGRTYAEARGLAGKVIDAVALPIEIGGVRFGRVKAEGPRDLGEDVDGVGYVHRASVDLLADHMMA